MIGNRQKRSERLSHRVLCQASIQLFLFLWACCLLDPAPSLRAQEVPVQTSEQEAPKKDRPVFKNWQWNGHIAVSYNYNLNGRNNTFRVFDDGGRQITLNQMEFWIEKPSTGESPLGFGVDIVLGADAKKIHASGLGTADDAFDLIQAYVTYRVPVGAGLELKAGKFVTLHGAEVIRRSGNFNVSRSFLFGYAIPFTHTGLMATYPLTHQVSVTLGIVNGWDNVADNNSGKSLHGMVSVTPRQDLSLTVGGTWGPEQTDQNGSKRGLVDVVVTYKPISPLTLIANFDYGAETNAVPDKTGGLQTARWYGLAAYGIYDIGERWSVGLRGEFFSDRQGFRFGWTDPSTGGPARLTLWEWTGTIRYKISDRLWASLEYRHDFANRPVFDGGTNIVKKSQGTVLIDLTLLFK